MATFCMDTPATIKQRATERHQAMKAEMEADAARVHIKAAETERMVDMVTRHAKSKEVSLENVKRAIHVDVKSLQKLGQRARNRSMVTLVFCFVILGCELDFLGFAGAFLDYWSGGRFIVQGLLVVMPTAYLLCVGLLLYQSHEKTGDVSGRNIGDSRTATVIGTSDNQTVTPNANASELDRKTRGLVRRPQVSLTWYHFLPMARYILIIKSIEKNDIEGIFRVNSLSSFTLGSCQTVGLAFAIMDNGNKLSGLSLFVYLNMISQVINWTITITYFTTSISQSMQRAIVVEAFKHNLSEQMRTALLELQVRICEDADQLASRPVLLDEDFPTQEEDVPVQDKKQSSRAMSVASSATEWQDALVPKMRQKLQFEIEQLRQCVVDLKYFEPIEILQLRRAVYLQIADEFDHNF